MENDYLMYVGECFYTKHSFIVEAQKLGVSKRVPYSPPNLVTGTTRVFLCMKHSIFAYFIVDRVEVILPDDTPPEKLRELFENGMTPLLKSDVEDEEERGCGFRKEGTYLVGDNIILINPNILYTGAFCRGMVKVDGEAIMNRVAPYNYNIV